MATKQELQAKIAKMRELAQELDSVMSDVTLSLEEEHGLVGAGPMSDPTAELYDEIASLETHVESLP